MTTLRFNLPTVLTLSRIVLIPFFVLSVNRHPVFGALLFSIASLTDFLEGYLARRSGQITTFGIIMDPIADKFPVISPAGVRYAYTNDTLKQGILKLFLEPAERLKNLKLGDMGFKLKEGQKITDHHVLRKVR